MPKSLTLPSSGLGYFREPESGGGAPRLLPPLGGGGRDRPRAGSWLCPIGQARSASERSYSGSPAAEASRTPDISAPSLEAPQFSVVPNSSGTTAAAILRVRDPATRSLRSHHAANVSPFAVVSREWGGGAGDPPELGLRLPDASAAALYRRRCPQFPTASGHTWTACGPGRQGAAQG